VPEGKHYNEYYPGHIITMAAPLSDGMVAYEDETPETVEQYAKDVTHFLAWAAEPELEDRKRLGIQVILFLLVFTGIMYAIKRKVWADVH
jgi:cytochrome c1